MYWEPSRARTLSIHWPSSYFSGVLGALKVSQRCKTAQRCRHHILRAVLHKAVSTIHLHTATEFSGMPTPHSPERLSCAKLCCWVLFSYISGLLEDRAIIQSSLMRWSHSFRLGWRLLKLDDDCPPFLSQHGLWRNSGAATRSVTCKQAHVTQSPIPLCVLSMNSPL